MIGTALVLVSLLAWGAESPDPGPSLAEGSRLRQAGQLPQAEAAFLQAVEHGGGPSAWTELATTRAWAGNLDGASHAYRRALDEDPAYDPAREGLARVTGWAGRTRAARRSWLALIDEDPSSAERWLGLARVEVQAQRPGAARRALQAAAALPSAPAAELVDVGSSMGPHRTTGSVTAGSTVSPSGSARPLGSVQVNHRFGHGWSGQVEGRATSGSIGGDAPTAAVRPALTAGVRSERAGRAAGLGAGASFGPSHATWLSLSGEQPVQGWIVGASLQPTLRDDSPELGLRLSAQRPLRPASWAMVTAGHNVASAGQRSTSLGLSYGTELGPFDARMDAGWIALAGADLITVGASWTLPCSDAVDGLIAVEGLAGRFEQVTIRGGLLFR